MGRVEMLFTVPDFTPVPIQRSDFLGLRVILCLDWHLHDVFPLLTQFIEEYLPYLPTFFFFELWVV